ncbi:MAG: FAD-binding oxidoreductase [Candidatus Lokiarchaeota archaeon]
MDEISKKLEEIVGKNFVSDKSEELYIYSIDPGASEPREVNFVILPKTVEEIQKIVSFANQEKIPITTMGGGLTLSGLTIPVKGGIVLDTKRMDKILEVNETSRYVVLEAGVSTGKIFSYIEQNYPHLQISIPDAPPSVTISGNTLIHGSGYLSQQYGNHGEMINGIELVLPTCQLCKLGSCSISKYWFSRGPIPDLIGMFISSFGTLGIITKLSIKLFPKQKERDLVFGLMKNPDVIPELINSITSENIVEDILLGKADKPDWMKGYVFVITYITGRSQNEINEKESILKKQIYLEKPQFAATAADFRKGGGFEYVGSFMPLEEIPEAIKLASEISYKYNIIPTLGCRVISQGHTIMFFASYSFNRADPDDIINARSALHETNKMVLSLGGIPWKSELKGQKLILDRIDPAFKNLFKTIKDQLDPNGIMNPGNWEV